MAAVLIGFRRQAQLHILQVLDDAPQVETRAVSIAGVDGTRNQACRASLGQGNADLEAPGLAPFPVTLARGATLFQNVRIFDGKSDPLYAPSDVLVKGNTTERISAPPITVDTKTGVRVIAAARV
jgi:hypothetical protein